MRNTYQIASFIDIDRIEYFEVNKLYDTMIALPNTLTHSTKLQRSDKNKPSPINVPLFPSCKHLVPNMYMYVYMYLYM